MNNLPANWIEGTRHQIPDEPECPVCEGSGYKTVQHKSIECSACSGYGYVSFKALMEYVLDNQILVVEDFDPCINKGQDQDSINN
jgi:DnaJ-class molecular chaperone